MKRRFDLSSRCQKCCDILRRSHHIRCHHVPAGGEELQKARHKCTEREWQEWQEAHGGVIRSCCACRTSLAACCRHRVFSWRSEAASGTYVCGVIIRWSHCPNDAEHAWPPVAAITSLALAGDCVRGPHAGRPLFIMLHAHASPAPAGMPTGSGWRAAGASTVERRVLHASSLKLAPMQDLGSVRMTEAPL